MWRKSGRVQFNTAANYLHLGTQSNSPVDVIGTKLTSYIRSQVPRMYEVNFVSTTPSLTSYLRSQATFLNLDKHKHEQYFLSIEKKCDGFLDR